MAIKLVICAVIAIQLAAHVADVYSSGGFFMALFALFFVSLAVAFAGYLWQWFIKK